MNLWDMYINISRHNQNDGYLTDNFMRFIERYFYIFIKISVIIVLKGPIVDASSMSDVMLGATNDYLSQCWPTATTGLRISHYMDMTH